MRNFCLKLIRLIIVFWFSVLGGSGRLAPEGDNYMMDRKLEYIHNNPVASGIVDEPMHYLYSSARDYAGIKGLLDVKLIV